MMWPELTSVQQGLIIYFGIVNCGAFILFGFDKWMARGRGWRVSEKMLWFVALIGGSIGALVGMNFFRHKTRKASFQFIMALIVFIHAAIVVLVPWLSSI